MTDKIKWNTRGPRAKMLTWVSSYAFMPVLVISNLDDDLIKNELASMETPFSHYKSMGNFLDAPEQLTP